jgi:hypothetical protein
MDCREAKLGCDTACRAGAAVEGWDRAAEGLRLGRWGGWGRAGPRASATGQVNAAEGQRAPGLQAIGEPMTTMVESAEHLYRRPSWQCQVCGQPWPCAGARGRMLDEFRMFPTVLAIYLASQLYDALGDIQSRGQPVPPDLYERFVAWARHD